MGELESCNTTPLYSTIGLVPVSFSRRPYAHHKMDDTCYLTCAWLWHMVYPHAGNIFFQCAF